MTPEEKSLLERTHKLAEENNNILRKIRRSSIIGTAFRIFYWVVIIGLGLGAYYFLQPYLFGAIDVINKGQEAISELRGQIGGTSTPR